MADVLILSFHLVLSGNHVLALKNVLPTSPPV